MCASPFDITEQAPLVKTLKEVVTDCNIDIFKIVKKYIIILEEVEENIIIKNQAYFGPTSSDRL